MIKKTKEGYVVLSEKGKPISPKNLTKKQAESRLATLDFFRHSKTK